VISGLACTSKYQARNGFKALPLFVNLAKGNSLMLGMKSEEVLKFFSLPCLNILYKIGIFSEWNIPFYFRGKFYQRR
jgi:cytochrome c oxidase assembly factor CtaG